ncbi:hypothetical protein L6164_027620 [Bauhinia variegata]|uniref:Uncharacterized protein n=1 Tax=Bauhinia variegata TaxID=167791 RepID=A0ACB9LTZ7_BAUVA|nr:hypothetical protein L6164_027620 [Bauhinia variegata]
MRICSTTVVTSISMTVEEFEQGHVDTEKIINIPYLFHTPEGGVKNPLFLKQVSSVFHKEDHIIVGCQIGVRSLSAAADLVADGFEDVKNMEGGYLEWVKSGFPAIQPAVKEI